jgi:hypothetical protein
MLNSLFKYPIMKTKMIVLLLVVSAIVTLSFTVTSVGDNKTTTQNSSQTEPVGGFVAEDKL